MNKDYTWEELTQLEEGTICNDWYDEGVRCIIMRGPASICVYFGLPINHPLSGFDYDSLNISCHGGLTFAGEGDGKWRPKEFYWYGFDYGHSGDYVFYYDREPLKGQFNHSDDVKWTPELVKKDIWSSLYDFKTLVKLSEKIKAKP